MKAKAEASDGRPAGDCFMDVPLTTNLDARGAGCPAWLRNVEPMGRGQNCLLAFTAGFRGHDLDPDLDLFGLYWNCSIFLGIILYFLELFDLFQN